MLNKKGVELELELKQLKFEQNVFESLHKDYKDDDKWQLRQAKIEAIEKELNND